VRPFWRTIAANPGDRPSASGEKIASSRADVESPAPADTAAATNPKIESLSTSAPIILQHRHTARLDRGPAPRLRARNPKSAPIRIP